MTVKMIVFLVILAWSEGHTEDAVKIPVKYEGSVGGEYIRAEDHNLKNDTGEGHMAEARKNQVNNDGVVRVEYERVEDYELQNDTGEARMAEARKNPVKYYGDVGGEYDRVEDYDLQNDTGEGHMAEAPKNQVNNDGVVRVEYDRVEDYELQNDTGKHAVSCVKCNGMLDSTCNVPFSMEEGLAVNCTGKCEIAVFYPSSSFPPKRLDESTIIRGCEHYAWSPPPPGYDVMFVAACKAEMCNTRDENILDQMETDRLKAEARRNELPLTGAASRTGIPLFSLLLTFLAWQCP